MEWLFVLAPANRLPLQAGRQLKVSADTAPPAKCPPPQAGGAPACAAVAPLRRGGPGGITKAFIEKINEAFEKLASLVFERLRLDTGGVLILP